MSSTACLNDDNPLSPMVQGCRDDFDFTLSFEMMFLTLLPASILIITSIPRIICLASRPVLVEGLMLKTAKTITISLYAILKLAHLILSSINPNGSPGFSISSTVVSFISSLFMIGLSRLEHSRSARPSILLQLYLFISLLFDIARTRSLWLAADLPRGDVPAYILTSVVGVEALLLLLESRAKSEWLHWRTDEYSPEQTSGLLRLGTLLWLNPLLLSGYQKVLHIDDLYPLDRNLLSKGLYHKLAPKLEAKRRTNRNSLLKSLVNSLAVPLLLPIGPRIILIAFRLFQPLLLEALLHYLQEPMEGSQRNTGYGLIGATSIIYMGIAFSTVYYNYLQERFLIMLRSSLATELYKKITEKSAAVEDSTPLTLMSTDVESIRVGLLNVHEFWANGIEAALAALLLERQIGVAIVAPLAVVCLCVAASALVARHSGPRQKSWMEKVQGRISWTTSAIQQMRELRISGLTDRAEALIQDLRLDEIKVGNNFRLILAFCTGIAFVPVTIAPVVMFIAAGDVFNVAGIYTSISYLLILTGPLTQLFQIVPGLLAAIQSLGRIQTFLERKSRVEYRQWKLDQQVHSKTRTEGGGLAMNHSIQIVDGVFGWKNGQRVLRDINLTINQTSLTIVVGPVASGKSTLCQALLGEVPVSGGEVIIGLNTRKIGYCSQTPYLLNTSIKDNIVCFAGFDEARYKEVLEATMLQFDLKMLPQGDATYVGSNGLGLSGGQKQRVAIARALYAHSDFLIFDSSLSGLDTETEKAVLDRIFGPNGLIRQRKAAALLCTHSMRHVPYADQIVVLGAEGTILKKGSFDELSAALDHISNLNIKKYTSDIHDVSNTDSAALIPVSGLDLTRTYYTGSAPVVSDDLKRMNGDIAVFQHYFKSLGFRSRISILIFGVGFAFFYNWPRIWLNYWSVDMTSASRTRSNAFYIGIYAVFQIFCLLSLFFLVLICSRLMISVSGSRLHQAALQTLMNAPLAFLIATDTGIITNLFSQDIYLVDTELPNSLSNVALDGFAFLGVTGVIASSSPWIVISYPILISVLYGLQRFYLRTSRQLRLLALEANSPLYTHYLDTVKGIVTMRALGWIEQNIESNNMMLDTSQRAAYLLAMVQQWLGLTLNLIVAIVAVMVVTLAAVLHSATGFTGASLVTVMSLGTNLSNIIRMYTLFETSMGAVGRLKRFSDEVMPEDQGGETFIPPKHWPTSGTINIVGISASYGNGRNTDSQNVAVKNINLFIPCGKRVAICGRTGSGKSSLLLLLLRLLDPLPSTSGTLTIDEVPLCTIHRRILRERIIAIPQTTVFLPDGSTIRANLDPYGVASVTDCIAVLDAVNIWSYVTTLGGLDASLSVDFLSHGQRQLFSLARAVLRRRLRSKEMESMFPDDQKSQCQTGILLLDEASSSVDHSTECLMQEVIQAEFSGWTVIAVTHQLPMIMEYDQVVVMDQGSIVETGQPKELVQARDSYFRKLWLRAKHI